MKKLEIQRIKIGDLRPNGIVRIEIDHEATLQSLCDAVNDLQVAIFKENVVNTFKKDVEERTTPKHFNAEKLQIMKWVNGGYYIDNFKSEAEAQAALELLLNL